MQYKPVSKIHLLNDANIQMRHDDKCAAVFEQIFDTHQIDARAEMKMDLNLASKSVNKNFHRELDSPKKGGEHNSLDEEDLVRIYSSRHMFGALKVINTIRSQIEARKNPNRDLNSMNSIHKIASLIPQAMQNNNMDP